MSSILNVTVERPITPNSDSLQARAQAHIYTLFEDCPEADWVVVVPAGQDGTEIIGYGSSETYPTKRELTMLAENHYGPDIHTLVGTISIYPHLRA